MRHYGKSKDRDDFNKVVNKLRSNYAVYQLGASPKVLATQPSLLLASTSLIDYKSIIAGIGIRHSDVDEYCQIAKLRNYNQDAVLAQDVLDRPNIGKAITNKIGDKLMSSIGFMDRFTVK